ncbi:MAG TPA: hypothetical protein VEA80_09900 [Vitreimonas sp.]|uniref:hypothetical protein n=1 Tax=Vitreimonas sp. TaxID=3069702 RepID=UPI002D5AD90B|nr:hypothetical protein [Vitreimonas sp.]HYD87778.1 hypothetical protein [Vitreimonas sp.]
MRTAQTTRNADAALAACAEVCRNAAAASEACEAACLRSGRLDSLRRCLELSGDCADLCRSAARIAARPRAGVRHLKAVLRVCAALCEEYAVLCGRHDDVPACIVSKLACAQCVAACKRALSLL